MSGHLRRRKCWHLIGAVLLMVAASCAAPPRESIAIDSKLARGMTPTETWKALNVSLPVNLLLSEGCMHSSSCWVRSPLFPGRVVRVAFTYRHPEWRLESWEFVSGDRWLQTAPATTDKEGLTGESGAHRSTSVSP
jgi:hypothetical protein